MASDQKKKTASPSAADDKEEKFLASTAEPKHRELLALLLLALSFLTAFLLWAPFSGVLGKLFKDLSLGLSGTASLALPLIFLYLSIEIYLERTHEITHKRLFYILLLFFCLISLVGVFSLDLNKLSDASRLDSGERLSALRALAVLWRSGPEPLYCCYGEFWSGGLLGGLNALGLLTISGRTGSLIVLVSMILALCALVFNLSWADTIKKTAKGISDTGRKVGEKSRQMREQFETARLERSTATENENFAPVEADAPIADDFGVLPQDAEARAENHFPVPCFLKKRRSMMRGQRPRPMRQTTSERQLTAGVEYQLPGGDWSLDPPSPTRPAPAIRPFRLVPRERPVAELKNHEDKLGAEEARSQSDRGDQALVGSAELREIAKEIREEKGRDERNNDRESWRDRSESKGKKTINRSRQISLIAHYNPPPLNLLNEDRKKGRTEEDKERIRLLGAKLEKTLNDFGVDAKVVNFTTGPTISRFELTPGPGVKVSRIVGLSDDIALALAAVGVRIEAPIPGKSAIGIEIPNKKTEPVLLRGILESEAFREARSPLTAALGRDIQGHEILCDLSKMPHILIAGATGSGKSVCINSILISLLYRSGPEELRLLMIDPKVVELSIYNGIPHLLQPVVTDPKKAYGVLEWAVQEMTKRYGLFADNSVRDFSAYNELVKHGQIEDGEKLPLILIVIDELSDLMATTPAEVENAIARLTAMARAAGIHLIIATQRPSVDVITGVIKANIPSRTAFAVASQVDSRTIIDMGGAEKLLGKGDMLYYPQSASKPQRGQGAFVTDAEVERVIKYLKNLYADNYDETVGRAIELAEPGAKKNGRESIEGREEDELLMTALRTVIENGYASVSLLQRRLMVGHPRAARLVDSLHDRGWIGPPEGSKPRKVLMSMNDYEHLGS